jgi:tetratricopeptide (TPR) repeat protein
MLMSAGRVREAVPAFERAEALDPFYSMAVAYAGWGKALVGRRDEAVAEARRALELDPDNEAVNNIFGEILSVAGLREEAVAHARRRVPATTSVRRLGFYGLVLASGGARDDALGVLRRIEATPAGHPGRTSALIRVYLGLGDTTRALAMLERAASSDGDLVLSQAVNSPEFDAIRGSARFSAVMRKFNVDVARLSARDGGRSR